MHTSTLRSVGGSVAVTLPRQFLRSLGLSAGAVVNVEMSGGSLVLTPARPRYILADLLAGMEPGDMPADADTERAAPVGREAW
ncbi:AbrB/MazE/SpoVT family DNA-binding domain-containing protein [Sphaerotilus sp.]|jgi:antitoxin component of MazEF toxin-antitoxin module|uniref:AbrB/MazE/SpoVT family DNA-binding domain-containing protein n=1 Tax=Sphaerotilus sp. TaxID=2093942 RepID=UPI0025DEA442|nr:AbrB/MazE/SpoVT family DNA-binding domain-containing protein [Sphaerotilus sp.]